MVGFVVVSQIF